MISFLGKGFFYFLFFVIINSVECQSIADKILGEEESELDFDAEVQKELQQTNIKLAEIKKELLECYKKVQRLYESGANEEEFGDLLQQINILKKERASYENNWKEKASPGAQESYGLWNQPETTIGQLVVDYGAQEYVYMMSQEISEMKLTICSHIPVPIESWGNMLEIILEQNGIGVERLNSFLCRLYLLECCDAKIQYVTNRRSDLKLFPSNVRVCFLLSPVISDSLSIVKFLEKFSSLNKTSLHLVNRDILIVSEAARLIELLKLYDFVQAHHSEQEYKIVTLRKIDIEDMQVILQSMFANKPLLRDTKGGFSENGLNVVGLKSISNTLLLVGTKAEIARAEELIQEIEEHIDDSKEKVIFWYIAKHSKAEELSGVLSKAYDMMISSGISANVDTISKKTIKSGQSKSSKSGKSDAELVVNPKPVSSSKMKASLKNEPNDHFITDAKTGAIIMVVEQEMLPKLKQLIKKLDVPKKMVRIEVLLFEKRINDSNRFGINLLKLGTGSSLSDRTNLNFNATKNSTQAQGLLQFLIARTKRGNAPSYDLAYNFLISQDDIHINANPSLITVNQTPASIHLVDEMSINTGAVEVSSGNDTFVKDAYERKQYGITINMTPTIHSVQEDDEDSNTDFITLQMKINFDTNGKSTPANSRPDIFRREIENEVRIADGQSVILGGLRQKSIKDSRESIPFLGEIPGVGKFFSRSEMADLNTEMFIFITPKIIKDPIEELEQVKREEMQKRMGDIPEFLKCLESARNYRKRRLFASGMRMLFDLNE